MSDIDDRINEFRTVLTAGVEPPVLIRETREYENSTVTFAVRRDDTDTDMKLTFVELRQSADADVMADLVRTRYRNSTSRKN